MKIEINSVKEIPSMMGNGLCVFGESEMHNEWAIANKIKTFKSHDGKFTNFDVKEHDIEQLFHPAKIYQYVDGFSPNLNKHLHIGHLSNLVLARSFQSLGIGKQFIAILGDTLEGFVSSSDALEKYLEVCKSVGYNIDQIFFASMQKINNDDILLSGEGEYQGSKVFHIGDEKIVGIKSNGETSYFYQDVALAQHLNAPTLYLTGFEQNEHFKNLKKIFPECDHLPLGLLMLDGKKMSSSEGNVIMFEELMNNLQSKFENNDNLVWNIACGFILKTQPTSIKNFSISQAENVKMSPGLYLSYTLARLKSAGIYPEDTKEFHSWKMKFKATKAKILLQPNLLFEECIEIAKEISSLYTIHTIKGNPNAKDIFQPLAEDLLLGMKTVGLKNIEKV